MCGRTACTLAPDEISEACCQIKYGGICTTTWVDHPGNKTYSPSTNIAPSCYTPVIFRGSSNAGSKGSLNGEAVTYADDHFSIMPMRWGYIPSYLKAASTSEFLYKTSNCRLEMIEEKNMYKASLEKGQRCVVLCDGFYEWQTTQDWQNKQPFFIHAPQPNGIEIWNRETFAGSSNRPRLLMMAGLYSQWLSTKDEEIYSYTIITMDSGDNFSWLHHRVPAILNTFDDANNWLECGSYKEKLSRLTNKCDIRTYKVSKLVNNSRHQQPSIMKPIQSGPSGDQKPKMTASQKLMSDWLKPSSKSTTGSNQPKKEPRGIMESFLKTEE